MVIAGKIIFFTDDTGDNIVLKTFILTGVLVSEDVPSSSQVITFIFT